jgi:threonyl-tRNA synthetase
VVGEKEQSAGAVSLRRRGSGDLGSRELGALIAEMKEIVASRAPVWTPTK